MASPVIDNRSLQQSNTNVTTLSVTPPTGIQDGDLLVATMAISAGGENAVLSNVGTGATWTIIQYTQSGGVSWGVYTKIANNESGNYLFSWDTIEKIVACVYRITGNDTTSFFEEGTPLLNNSDNPAIALSTTPTTNDTLVLAFYGIDADRITDDQADGGTGWTTEFIRETVGGAAAQNITCGVSHKSIGTATASLDSSQILDVADNHHTVQVVFKSPEVTGFIHSHGYIIG